MENSVDMKLLKQTKFPPEFNKKVDMKKVNIEVMKKWIAGKISDILGNEDDVVVELCFNLLEASRFPDIKKVQISLTGFLDKDTASFCKELWNLCLSAQSNPQGVPKELLEAKKLELIQEKIDAEKAAAVARERQEQERIRDREVNALRQRDRERGGGRGRGDGRRGGRYGRDADRLRSRDSLSPPPRQGVSPDRGYQRGHEPKRHVDTYIPSRSRGGPSRNERRRPRSPGRDRSFSRSPPRSVSPVRDGRRRNNYEPRQRKFRRSPSRSSSPPRERLNHSPHDSGRGRGGRSGRGDHRQRSASYSETSRSRSRRRHYRKRTRSRSVSDSPRPHRRKRDASRSVSPSRSRTRSRSRSPLRGPDRRRPERPPGRDKPSQPHPSRYHADHTRADARKDDRSLGSGARRHSRSRSSRERRPRQHRPRSHHSSRDRSPSRSRSRSRSPRRSKKHRSIERYEPVAKRRRNSSSSVSSSAVSKRRAKADLSSGGEESRSVSGDGSRTETRERGGEPVGKVDESRPPPKTENELREALLREKVRNRRRSSTDN